MVKKREIWIDNLKIFACVLVVAGHFFQSMVTAGFIEDSFIYQWFNKTIYYFHVPLFFICSGYLYQKYTDTSSFSKWGRNVLLKAIALLIPYVVFSVVTWFLKNVFADSVNQQTDGLFTSLLWEPISPYWYLFALFFIFLLIPVMKNTVVTTIVLFAAVALKALMIIPCGIEDIYIFNIIFGNIIWFTLGMSLFRFDAVKILKSKVCFIIALIVAVAFAVCSIWLAKDNTYNEAYNFLMGFAACFVFVSLAVNTENFRISENIASVCAKYTFPVFLMHTIFAATFRSLLSKVGITNSYLHIFAGILISFAGPVAVYFIASKIKFIDFFFYPNKYIKIPKKN